MTVDQIIKLIDVSAKLLGALAWPLVVLFLLTRLLPAILKTIPEWENVQFELFGLKGVFARKKAQASEALSDAARKPLDGSTIPQSDEIARAAEAVVARTVTPFVVRKVENSRVLWVDDRPSNNTRERQAFEALGIKFDLALDTDEALDMVSTQNYEAIISDMGRPSDPRAGYSLLEALRRSGNQTPFVIYAASNSPEHKAETRQRGGVDCTNRADELFQIVTTILTR